MKFWLQTAWLALAVYSLFSLLRRAVNGRPAAEPMGFPGVVIGILVWVDLMTWEYYAGFFSALVGGP